MVVQETTAKRETAIGLSSRVVIGVGLVVIAAYVSLLIRLMETSTYDTWGALIVGPLLIAVTFPALARQARREGDPRVLWILMAALVVKLLFAIVRHYQATELYSFADATGYHRGGTELAGRFLAGSFDTEVPVGLPSETLFMYIVTGVVYAVIRPTMLGGFVAFSWLAFLGLFLFYRAFHLAVPDGRSRTYAKLLFFLPSILFWPSSIGKEAWTVFTLGIAAFGAARLFAGRGRGRGIALFVLGLAGTAAVRPHFAGLFAVAAAIGYVVGRPRAEGRRFVPVAKLLTVAISGAVAVVLVSQTERFLSDSGLGGGSITSAAGIGSVLEETGRRTATGGSRFDPVAVGSPQGFAIATVTVLFRPFPFEADNFPTMLAAIEGVFLLIVVIVRLPWVLSALRRARDHPYVAAAFVYCGTFVIALSSIANFGILTRQRVLLLPMLLVLVSVPRVTAPPERAI
jgi:hypothetical protein